MALLLRLLQLSQVVEYSLLVEPQKLPQDKSLMVATLDQSGSLLEPLNLSLEPKLTIFNKPQKKDQQELDEI